MAVDLSSVNPLSPEFQQCPFPHYQAMQAEAPVFQVPGTNMFMVTRHEDMVPILRDTTTFSSAFNTGSSPVDADVIDRVKEIMSAGWPQVPTMLTIDPPWHTRFRGTIAAFFTPKPIAALRGSMVDIVNGLIGEWSDGDEFDFVKSFGVRLPIFAIADVLNVPNDRLDDFKRWSDDAIIGIGANPTADQRVEAMRGILQFQHYFAPRLEACRAAPIGDLMSAIACAEIDDGNGGKRQLEMAEMLSIVQQLLVAGNETTTKALTEGIRLLAENPEEWRKLKADPAGRAGIVTEEVLRLATPTQGMFRVVTADTNISGTDVAKGSLLVLVYSAANRDRTVFGDEPDSFDPDRAALKEHLAFGKGIHFCIGAPLSRLEMQVAFELLATRVDQFELLPTNDFEYHPSFVLRGLKRLDVRVSLST